LIALDNPATGGGFQAVTDPLLWRSYAPETPNFTMIETPPIPIDEPPKAAHNIYMQVLGDHGFVGLFIFLTILLLTLMANKANRKLAAKNNIVWCVKLSDAITLTLVGYCITGANVSLAYFDLFYAIVGIVAVIKMNQEKLIGSEAVPKTN
jgi:O-antigen ligase